MVRKGNANRMPYNNYANLLAGRIERRLEEMYAHHNFEYGTEFEIALCSLLRSVLPGRCGICRGYIVPAEGKQEGDDIIVYDAHRYPTLRALGQELGLKEQVPADAVLAYIEAKRTLYARPVKQGQPKLTGKQVKEGGQTIIKALEQVRKVKSIKRQEVLPTAIAPGIDLNIRLQGPGVEMTVEPGIPAGYPNIRNPWFTMILAQRLDVGGSPRRNPRRKTLFDAIEDYSRKNPPPPGVHPTLPDVIAAEDIFIFPVLSSESGPAPASGSAPKPATGGTLNAKWFLTNTTELVAINSRIEPIAMAFLHMFAAIETMLLAPLPIGVILQQALDPDQKVQWQKGRTPVR